QLKGATREDITVLRVIVKGKRNNKNVKLQWDMVDLFDQENQITSMAKTTGYPAIIMANLISNGQFTETGVITPEEIVIGDLFDPFMNELKRKGINIDFI